MPETVSESEISKVYNEASRKILKRIRKNSMRGALTLSDLCEKVDVNYTTTGKTVTRLEGLDLLKSREKGRTKEVKLTDRGKQIADKLMEINELAR